MGRRARAWLAAACICLLLVGSTCCAVSGPHGPGGEGHVAERVDAAGRSPPAADAPAHATTAPQGILGRWDLCWILTGVSSRSSSDLCSALDSVALQWRSWVAWLVVVVLLSVSLAQYLLSAAEYRTWCERMMQNPQYAAVLRDLMGESGPAKFYTPWVPTGIDWQEVLTRAMLQSRAEDDPPRDSAVAQSANETPRSVASLAVRANGHRVSGQCSTQLSPRMMTPGRSASQGQLTGVRPLSGPSPRFAAPCGPSPRLTPMGTGTPGSAGGRATGTPPVPRQLRRREMKDAKKHARGGRGTPRTGAGLEGDEQTLLLPLPGDQRMITILHNAKRPSWSRTIAVTLVVLPLRLIFSVLWAFKFVWKYCVLNRPYDFQDEAWLTKRALGLTSEFWRGMTLQEQMQLVRMRLWEAGNLARLSDAVAGLQTDREGQDVLEPLL